MITEATTAPIKIRLPIAIPILTPKLLKEKILANIKGFLSVDEILTCQVIKTSIDTGTCQQWFEIVCILLLLSLLILETDIFLEITIAAGYSMSKHQLLYENWYIAI